MKKIRHYLQAATWLLAGWGLLVSCTASKPSTTLKLLGQSTCEMDSSSTSGYVFHPLEIKPGSAEDSLLRHRFSDRSLRIAQAMGLPPLLMQLSASEQNQPTNGNVSNDYLLLRQRITDQIQLANFDVASAAAILDCDVKRANQTADLLTRQDNVRVKRLTIAAITIGAVTALVGGVLAINSPGHGNEYADVAGGVAEAGLGLSVFWIKPSKTTYRHARNPLGEVWNKKQLSATFPPIVWYYLSHPLPNQTSVIDQLRARWEGLTALVDEKKKRHRYHKADYFGEGGDYSAEALTVRANMVGQLEAEIRLMNNDLTILLNELVSHSAKR